MFEVIKKRIGYGESPVRRFASLHTWTVAGIAGLVAISGAALAVFRHRRNGSSHLETLAAGEADGHENGGSTRDELYEMARQQDIPRRSTMNKAELEKALGE